MSPGNAENLIAFLVVALVALVVGLASTLMSEYLSNEAGIFLLAHAKRLKLRRQALGQVREKHAKFLDEAREELGLRAAHPAGGPVQSNPPFKAPPPPPVNRDALKWNPPHLEETGPCGVVDLDALKKI
jgi:hypothetical protein